MLLHVDIMKHAAGLQLRDQLLQQKSENFCHALLLALMQTRCTHRIAAKKIYAILMHIVCINASEKRVTAEQHNAIFSCVFTQPTGTA